MSQLGDNTPPIYEFTFGDGTTRRTDEIDWSDHVQRFNELISRSDDSDELLSEFEEDDSLNKSEIIEVLAALGRQDEDTEVKLVGFEEMSIN